jgi:hypothetical protein
MINITHMIYILNVVFTVVLYVTRWTKQDPTYIYFKEFLNQSNLLYIYICLYLQYILNYVFICSMRWDKQNKIPLTYILKNF